MRLTECDVNRIFLAVLAKPAKEEKSPLKAGFTIVGFFYAYLLVRK